MCVIKNSIFYLLSLFVCYAGGRGLCAIVYLQSLFVCVCNKKQWWWGRGGWLHIYLQWLFVCFFVVDFFFPLLLLFYLLSLFVCLIRGGEGVMCDCLFASLFVCVCNKKFYILFALAFCLLRGGEGVMCDCLFAIAFCLCV